METLAKNGLMFLTELYLELHQRSMMEGSEKTN